MASNEILKKTEKAVETKETPKAATDTIGNLLTDASKDSTAAKGTILGLIKWLLLEMVPVLGYFSPKDTAKN